MNTSEIKEVRVSFLTIAKDSFDFTKKNYWHVLKVQWPYFVILYLMTYLPEHINTTVPAKFDNANNLLVMPHTTIIRMAISFFYEHLRTIVSYALGIIFINTLYEWLIYGRNLKPFYTWPISKHVWLQMIFDVKVVCVSSLPMIVILIAVIPFWLNFITKPEHIMLNDFGAAVAKAC